MTSYWELQTLALDDHVRTSLRAASTSIDTHDDSALTTSIRRWLLGAIESFSGLLDGQASLWKLAGGSVDTWLGDTALLRERVTDEDDRMWVAWLARAVMGALHEHGIDDPLLGEVALSAIAAIKTAEPPDGDRSWWEGLCTHVTPLTAEQTEVPAVLSPPPGVPSAVMQSVYDRWILQAAQVLADEHLLPAVPQTAGEWASAVMSRALSLLTAGSCEEALSAWAECGAEALRALSALADKPLQDEGRAMIADSDTASFSDPDQRLERLLRGLVAAAQIYDGVVRGDEWAHEQLAQMTGAAPDEQLAAAAYAQLLADIMSVCCEAIADETAVLPEVPAFDPTITAGRIVAELREQAGEDLDAVATGVHQVLAIFAARQHGHRAAREWCTQAIAGALEEIGEPDMEDCEVLTLMLCDALEAGLSATYDQEELQVRFGELMPLMVDLVGDIASLEDIDPVAVPSLPPEIAAWLRDATDTSG